MSDDTIHFAKSTADDLSYRMWCGEIDGNADYDYDPAGVDCLDCLDAFLKLAESVQKRRDAFNVCGDCGYSGFAFHACQFDVSDTPVEV